MKLFKKALDILPSAMMSRAFGTISDIQFPGGIQKRLNRAFVKLANIDMGEAENPVDGYTSLNELFTRRLKPGSRTIESADVVSPVDGRLSFAGMLSHGSLIEAKGHVYDAASLIAEPGDNFPGWIESAFAFIIYLSPRNYHRIHAPVSGSVTRMTYAPGRLLPVNRLGYMLTDDLLPANERLASFMSSSTGHPCILVKVGATCVGRISIRYNDFITNKAWFRNAFAQDISPAFDIHAGDELACFELGSTVVLLVESDGFSPNTNLAMGQTISMGMSLGSWQPR